jgi:TolA-binding protein
MAFLRQSFFIAFALLLGGGQVFAASGREDRAYAAAASAFQDAMWSRAETEFAQFTQKYPKSDRVAEAVLLQAEAEFKQEKYPQAIALLQTRKAGAGNLADQYVYWMGEAQFQNGDYSAAAETFVSLTRDFPESSLRLRGVVEEAAAYAQSGHWRQHDALLENTNGVFQQAAQLDPRNELVVAGQLSLENSKYEQRDYSGVTAIYGWLASEWQTLNQQQQCQGTYLFYRAKMAAGDFAAALSAAASLVQIARSPTNQEWLATGWASQGAVLEQMNRLPEAIRAWQNNLTGAPVTQEREAILKIAELQIVRGQLTNAEETLANFLAQFPETISADIALLTAGELHMKGYAAQQAATNQLPAAWDCFNQFLRVYANSPLAGKAYLDRGWCEWLVNDMTNSLADFEAAAQQPLSPEDRAVARFKTGDALFALTNYTGALENYRAVIEDFTNVPAVVQSLEVPALYQSLRASLELKDVAGASNAMARIMKLSPAGDLNGASLLLVGEGLMNSRQQAAARTLYEGFVDQFPANELRPQVELAIARTYEQERNWPAAIGKYSDWLKDYSTNARLRPQADYALALADFRAGNESNAFVRLTNFVAQFPTNDLAPLAQWWVADHFFRTGDFVDAEKNFQLFFQNFPTNDLVYQARMMAGRAAMGRLSFRDAIRYFTNLTSDANCPSDLDAKALFAYGSALMQGGAADTNSPSANFERAASVFGRICQLYPTNELGALAWGEIGDCDLQLAAYDAATNAYAQVIASPFANVSARSQAQIGLGIALEKKAALAAGNDQRTLLELALNNYVDVLHETNLRDDETADLFWVKKAGLQAAALAEALGEWEQAANIYGRLEKKMPQLSELLEGKIIAAQGHFPPKKN